MQTLVKPGFAEQTITKSKFLAWVAQCQSEREVGVFLNVIANEHNNASHLAYAFRIKTKDGVVPRFSDAGEPSGTAGRPILQMLEGRDLINVCVAVVRYYGGINLGTGGLARAYGGTAKMALDGAIFDDFVEMQELKLIIHYNRVDELTRVVSQLNGKVLDKSFQDAVHVKVRIPVNQAEAFLARFR